MQLFYFCISELRSWCEVPSIAHFCSLFRAAFDLPDFDIEVIYFIMEFRVKFDMLDIAYHCQHVDIHDVTYLCSYGDFPAQDLQVLFARLYTFHFQTFAGHMTVPLNV